MINDDYRLSSVMLMHVTCIINFVVHITTIFASYLKLLPCFTLISGILHKVPIILVFKFEKSSISIFKLSGSFKTRKWARLKNMVHKFPDTSNKLKWARRKPTVCPNGPRCGLLARPRGKGGLWGRKLGHTVGHTLRCQTRVWVRCSSRSYFDDEVAILRN
jgi:hypothetical protein